MGNEDFRSDIREVFKRHDLDHEDLRELAADLETLADEWETMEAVI